MFRMTCRLSTFRAEVILQDSKGQTVVASFFSNVGIVYQITGCHIS
jgi:hypothetical protein